MAPNIKSARRAREIEHTRRDIIDAAARVFAQAGFHEATMQAIAREVGFTAASLYTYFKSKDEIYEALVDEFRGAFLATFDAHLPAGLTFEQRLELLVQRQFELAFARRQALRIIFDLGPRHRCRNDEDGPLPLLRRMTEFLAASGAREHLRFPPEEAARVLFGITQALFLPWIVAGAAAAPDPAREAAHAVELLLRGAGRPAGG
ncbi:MULTISPECIES: TetR/AcrR family transcriptional regulator [Anaeromyxobacter]|uniref:TetR/AcrR family transcriptional regulator n=1 Tax=Anaeromyxobacter TaxID=161492 RepID=UPI001F55D25C|nr:MULTISPECIES: TetR/AcrR family transcriptional regulator [unclassified Anaeromyxobacter]